MDACAPRAPRHATAPATQYRIREKRWIRPLDFGIGSSESGARGISGHTRVLPACGHLLDGWNGERERCAWAIVWLCPQASVMFLDNGATHGESDTHAFDFRRVERIEQFIHTLKVEPHPGIPDGHAYAIISVPRSSDQQLPRTIVDGHHCVRRVTKKVQDHLLKLDAITGDERQIIGELGLQHDPISLEVAH